MLLQRRQPEPELEPLSAPHEWLCLAVPFVALGRDGPRWRALRLQFELCGYCLHADGRLVAIGD